jgi:hypothetical protein
MARRSVPAQPEDRILSPSEIRNGIERLQQRIADLVVAIDRLLYVNWDPETPNVQPVKFERPATSARLGSRTIR